MLPTGFLDKFDHAVQREKYAGRASDPAFLLLLAEQDNQIVGMISAKDNYTAPLEFEKQIAAMYIDPGYQSRGIGSALIKSLRVELQTRDVKNLMLWCIEHNHRACAFYKKHGAQKITGTPLPPEYAAMPHVVYAWSSI